MDKVVYRTNDKIKSDVKPVAINPFFTNIFTKISLLIVSVFLLYNVYHSVIITVEKVKISKNAIEEVNSLRITNLELELELESMNSFEYVEVQARNRLNFSGENEYVFVIQEELMSRAKESVQSYLYPSDNSKDVSGYKRWFDFVYDGI